LFFMCPFCPLGCSVFARAHGPRNPGLVKNGASGARCGGIRPGTAPSRTVSTARALLDQWSRPPRGTRGALPRSTIPMRSRSARPAGKPVLAGDMPLMSRPGHAGYLPGMRRAATRCLRRWRRRLPSPGAASPLATSGYRLPGKLGRARPQPGRIPGADGFRAPGTPAAPRGLCAPGTAYALVWGTGPCG
jgi:hypothetical protein